jgi:hypothetical protein
MPDNENVAPHLKERVARIWAAAAARVADFKPRNRATEPVARTAPAPESERCPCCGHASPGFDKSDPDALLMLLKMPAKDSQQRDVQKAADEHWYVTFGGGEWPERTVLELMARGKIRPVFNDPTLGLYVVSGTMVRAALPNFRGIPYAGNVAAASTSNASRKASIQMVAENHDPKRLATCAQDPPDSSHKR